MTETQQTITFSLGGIIAALLGFHSLFIAPIQISVDKLEAKHVTDIKDLVAEQRLYRDALKRIEINQALILDRLGKLTITD